MGRYVHADPCEKSLDAPLTYEVGWNKHLSYVFSFSRFGVTDVIHRYSRKFGSTVCLNRTLCSEKFLKARVADLDKKMQAEFSQRRSKEPLFERDGALSLERLSGGIQSFLPSFYFRNKINADISVDEVLLRKYCQQRELLLNQCMQSGQLSVDELRGRISGDMEWKQSRGEAGRQSDPSGRPEQFAALEWLREVLHDLEALSYVQYYDGVFCFV